jgi:serine/threonine protein kinase
MSAPGDVLVDRYELRSRLGRGGMAEVFRAHDHRLDREVAVKVLAPHLLADARAVDRFDREARAAASLNHPNIVNVYDAVSDGDTHAIVMELVDGPTLAEVIAREGQLRVEDALPVAISIADALQAAHDRGLVHHDVKPRNVLFDDDGTVKVTDFGIARAASSDITTVQGSPPYLAPEQARGGQSDRRSDIYALGCVLFEMLAGRPPFEGDSSSAVIMQHIDTPAPPLSRFRDDLPRDLEQVVDRALAKDPDARYDSPAAMRADLTRIAGGLGGTLVAQPSDTIVSTAGGMPQDSTMALEDWEEQPPAYTDEYDEPPRRRRGISARTIAITLAAILLLLVLAMAFSDFGGTQTADTGPVVSEPAQQDTADQQDAGQGDGAQDSDGSGSNPIQDQIDRLNQAADRLQELAEQGRQADEATQRRIDELRRQLDEALAGAGTGGGGSESSAVQELRDRLNDLANDSEQTGDSVADRLRDLVEQLNPFGG